MDVWDDPILGHGGDYGFGGGGPTGYAFGVTNQQPRVGSFLAIDNSLSYDPPVIDNQNDVIVNPKYPLMASSQFQNGATSPSQVSSPVQQVAQQPGVQTAKGKQQSWIGP